MPPGFAIAPASSPATDPRQFARIDRRTRQRGRYCLPPIGRENSGRGISQPIGVNPTATAVRSPQCAAPIGTARRVCTIHANPAIAESTHRNASLTTAHPYQFGRDGQSVESLSSRSETFRQFQETDVVPQFVRIGCKVPYGQVQRFGSLQRI